jgi:transposase-like protein
MQRRIFSREFRLEAVKLIKERGVAVEHRNRQPPRQNPPRRVGGA